MSLLTFLLSDVKLSLETSMDKPIISSFKNTLKKVSWCGYKMTRVLLKEHLKLIGRNRSIGMNLEIYS